MIKKNSKFNYFSIILIILVTQGCAHSGNSDVSQAMSDNYSVSQANLQQTSQNTINENQVVNESLINNPGYKAAQLNADAAKSEYYSKLGTISPTASTGTSSGTNVGYSNLNPVSTSADILRAKELSEAEKMNAADYRRKLIEKARLETNEQENAMSMYQIAKANEAWQKKMAEKEMAKIKNSRNSKLAEAEYLNFKVKSLMAKADAIQAGQNYDTASYKLAATMGRTDAILPGNPEIIKNKNQSSNDNELNKVNLNHYLDLAIENRPDLKAQKDELKAAKYSLYSAVGTFSPSVTANNNSLAADANVINGGSDIAAIRQQEAEYGIKNEELKKKWISVVKEVRDGYVSLKANLAVREKYAQTLKEAQLRRDLIEKQFKNGKTDTATFNQAQNILIQTRKNFVQTEKNVSDSRAKLFAACGIKDDRANKPSIAELNQAQQMFIDTSRSLLQSEIGIQNAKAGLNAAAGTQ